MTYGEKENNVGYVQKVCEERVYIFHGSGCSAALLLCLLLEQQTTQGT